MSAIEARKPGWDAQRRASALTTRRARLVTLLPKRVPAAERLTVDARELVVDDAIHFAALDYEPAVHSRIELDRVFWDAAGRRVSRALEGRYDTVRAGYQRADLAALDDIAADEAPESATLARAELSAALHFAALLDPDERDVFLCQTRHIGRRPLGAVRIARKLGRPLGEVRAAERAIATKRERFATIYAAGRLCEFLRPALAALAIGDEDAKTAAGGTYLAARVHLTVDRCPTCTADYTRQLNYLRGERFARRVAALLPVTPTERPRSPISLPEWLPDWLSRLVSHEPTSAATQLAAGGARGLGTAAAAKLATACIAGVCSISACVVTGILPLDRPRSDPPARATPTPTPTATPAAPEPPLPHGVVTATPTPTSTPKPKRRTTTTRRDRTTQGGTGASSHEQTPASSAPADAPANGAGEFDPGYQPSAPAAPAPVPAAPGASEFF